MMPSSVRELASPTNVRGSLGTIFSHETTVWVSSATEIRKVRVESPLVGGVPGLLPPSIHRNDWELVAVVGLTITNQCFHKTRSTSLVVSHTCDRSSST